MGGPPGYDSVDWNADWIAKTPYYKILCDGQIVGEIIVFDIGRGHYELGRIYIDPDVQNRGIGQQAVKQMFEAFPEAVKWTLGTPSWAIRNRHFYEKMGFVKVRETEVDPNLACRSTPSISTTTSRAVRRRWTKPSAATGSWSPHRASAGSTQTWSTGCRSRSLSERGTPGRAPTGCR